MPGRPSRPACCRPAAPTSCISRSTAGTACT